MANRKRELPEKTCPVCQRPFQWRKKWAKVWDEVKFCSNRCRQSKSFRRNAVNEVEQGKGK